MNVLLIEDDVALGTTVVRGLEQQGFTVSWQATGEAGLAALETGSPDVVLLDLGLPDIDGFEVCRRIRATSDVPVIIVTARGDEVDRIVGLELGADDYVSKPFSLREVVARIRAVTRRSQASGATPQGPISTLPGGLSIDRREHRAVLHGEELALTPLEFSVLACLADDPGAVVRRADLVRAVWGSGWPGAAKALDVHVASLRRKLGGSEKLETIRGVGFRLGGGQ